METVLPERSLTPELRKTLWTAAALFALNVLCNVPLFLPGESPYRDSIEGGYASMARFIAEHPDPFGWNPTQYFGLPTHMWYLPGVPYTAALGIKLLPFLRPEHVYRLVVTTMACLVPVTAFLFAAYFTRSRLYAAMAALAITFWSPAYYYFWQIDSDRGLAQVPWRIQTLIKYGEGPHNMGLALLPLALIAAWRAGCRRRYADIFIAAVLFAAVVLTNWVAAMALAWCCAMMLLAGTGTAHETGFRARRLLAAAALAFMLACFWLTPGYIQTVAFNWPQDAFGFRLQARRQALLACLLLAPFALRLVFWKVARSFYPCFLLLCASGFTFVAYCHYWYGSGPIPESERYAVEAELFVLLLLFELLRRIMSSQYPVRVLAASVAVVVAVTGFYQVYHYPYDAWVMLRPTRRERSIEYKVASALNDLQPRGRVLATGGTRFRLNSWFLLPQVGGTFESGLRNRMAPDLLYSLRTGIGVAPEKRVRAARRQLRLAGVEYIAVHGRSSREHWKDFAGGQLPFARMFEPVWCREDDTIYRVPFQGYAHLIHERQAVPYRPINQGVNHLDPYFEALDSPESIALEDRWEGPNRLTIEGPIPMATVVSVMVSYDSGWRAWQNGKPIPIEEDGMGYLMLRPESAAMSRIDLHYVGSAEQKAFTAVSAISWVVSLTALRRSLRRKRGLATPP